MHAKVVGLSVTSSLALALLLAVFLRHAIEPAQLVLWLLCLGAAWAVRVLVMVRHRTAPPEQQGDGRWLRRYRGALLLHGCAWAMASAQLFLVQDRALIDLLVFTLLLIVGGGLFATAFDPLAAALFATPAAAPMLVYLLLHGASGLAPSGVLVVLILVAAGLAARRTRHGLLEAIAGRVGEARRSEELRRAAERLDRTGAVAHVGSWELQAGAARLSLSTLTQRILHLEGSAQPTLEEFLAAFAGPARTQLRAAIGAALANGEPVELEAALAEDTVPLRLVRVVGQARRDGERVVALEGALQDVTRLRAIDRELADQHELLQQLLRTTNQGFWFIDTQGRTQDLNPAMCQLLGCQREEALTRDVYSFLQDEGRALFEREMAARRQGLSGHYEMALVRPDGSRRQCLVNATPLYDARGVRTGSVGVWTDITSHHETEAALRVYEVAVNATAETVSVMDEHEVYRMVNDAWCRVTGLARHDVVGRHRREVLVVPMSDARTQALHECISQRRPTEVVDQLTFNGLTRDFHTSFYPIAQEPGRPVLTALVTRDVSTEVQQRAALVDGAEQLRATLEATGDAIFAIDGTNVDTPLPFANEQVYRIFGIPHGDAALTPRKVLLHALPLAEEPVADRQRMMDTMLRGASAEDRPSLRDGRVLLRRYAPARIKDRTLHVWSFRDITAEQRAQQAIADSAAEQQALLAAFPGFIAMLDGDERYQYVNDRLAAVFDLPIERIVGQPIADVLGPARWQALRPVLEQARREGRAVSESHHGPSSPHQGLDLEVTHIAAPQRQGSPPGIYAFGVDITERKRAQAALLEALAEADRANMAKSRFLSSMSHELRTPLNAVLGFGQLLARQPLEAPQRHQVEEILRGGRHLLLLIDDLLDIGRIEAGKLEVACSNVDAVPLIGECIGLVQPLAQEGAIALDFAGTLPSAPVHADARRLKQVLLNLLSNAIKYNRRGGTVSVALLRHPGELEIQVHDSGIGISAQERQRLFRPFERLGAGDGPVDGTGIGLALSRQLVQLMGGSIDVRSEPGYGSVFWVRLAAAAAADDGPAAAQSTAVPATAGGARRRALYIEDNPVNLSLMQALLEDELDLSTASEPQTGLELAWSLQPDLVLLDIQLPGMDGYQVLRRLRADPRTAQVPVIAVSANAMPADLAAGRAAGFADYLTKPLSYDALLDAVHRALATPRP